MQGVGILVPTILTVASRSTLAQTCLSPSATASINLLHSRPDRPPDGVCEGLSPGYWKNRGQSQSFARGISFSSVFPGGFNGSMFEALSQQGNGNFQALTRHLAAAWYNLQSGRVSPNILNLQDLQAMWAGRHGTYTPIAGSNVTWDDGQIVDYLKTTMS